VIPVAPMGVRLGRRRRAVRTGRSQETVAHCG
jgi:hypothetical protein